jgi:hypothetical protein
MSMTRKKFSDATRKKISESLRGRPNKLLSRACSCYTPSGEFVKSFTSLAEAEREYKVSHANVVRAIRKKGLAGGFHWSYDAAKYMPGKKTCKRCGNDLPWEKRRNVFCSYACLEEQSKEEHERGIRIARGGRPRSTLPTSTIGALAEFRVACDLLSNGFEVFRSVTPNASCDLLILRGGNLLRVEVRSTFKRHTGVLVPKYHWWKDKGRQDVFAFVAPDGEIRYIPDIRGLTETV